MNMKISCQFFDVTKTTNHFRLTFVMLYMIIRFNILVIRVNMHVYHKLKVLIRMMTKITTKLVQKHEKIDVNHINTSLLNARKSILLLSLS